ncbi:MAG: hypothetical protein GWO84_02725 [Euryarchaeota archaeon]|nr:hypothetical protein [Euryarchaeota archaeon]
MPIVNLLGLEFEVVEADSIFVGTDKGGWVYSGQRPRHEVKCPKFYILKEPISRRQIATILNGPEPDERPDDLMEGIDGSALKEILLHANSSLQKLADSTLDKEYEWEVRCPSEGEWRIAHQQIILNHPTKKVEILADSPASNYRGAMMDGSPRKSPGIGPTANHRAAIESHPTKNLVALSSIPMDRSLNDVITRLVITPIRTEPRLMVPDNADFANNLRGELFWMTILGIVPSFAIPILRGMSDYAVNGWPNLLFGGLCIGFVSGAFWRPRRPSITIQDVK